jgi:hypothetical protein
MLRLPLVLVALLALALAAPLAVLGLAEADRDAPGTPRATLAAGRAPAVPARNTFTRVTTTAQWRAGTASGTSAAAGSLRIAEAAAHRRLAGRTYDDAWWTSRWVTPKHRFTEVNPSWTAATPPGTWLSVRIRARADGRTSTWQSLGRWASGEADLLRTSLGAQRDALSSVSVDTLVARPGTRFTAYQLQVHLFRRQGTTATPIVRAVQAVASQLGSSVPRVSRPGKVGRVLPVPAYSQMVHRGEYPRYGGGGEAWCSPTSMAMVLAYYRRLPAARDYAWVHRSYPDRFVAEIARRVFDHAYDGTGNWPFNTGYAGARMVDAFLTRLPDLRAAERFIDRGIPLEVSISFGRGQLAGAPIASTAGHLVVIRGFTRSGDVVVNDPAARTNATVRRTYDRAQFEAAWLRRSHGLTYVVRDKAHPLPGYPAA